MYICVDFTVARNIAYFMIEIQTQQDFFAIILRSISVVNHGTLQTLLQQMIIRDDSAAAPHSTFAYWFPSNAFKFNVWVWIN